MRKIPDTALKRPKFETQNDKINNNKDIKQATTDEIHREMEGIDCPLDLSILSSFKQPIQSLEEQLHLSSSSSDEND